MRLVTQRNRIQPVHASQFRREETIHNPVICFAVTAGASKRWSSKIRRGVGRRVTSEPEPDAPGMKSHVPSTAGRHPIARQRFHKTSERGLAVH